MNRDREKREINKFLFGNTGIEVDAFPIYQWIERCYYEKWWELGQSLGACVPPNSLDDHFSKRLDYLLNECQQHRPKVEQQAKKSSVDHVPIAVWGDDMLAVVTDETEINSLNEVFRKKLTETSEQIDVKVGHKGQSYKMDVFWMKNNGLWSAFQKLNTRYWNAFGLTDQRPAYNSNLNIVVEVNPPIHGIDRRIGGGFLKDKKGNIFVMHRGKIGGSKIGVNPSLFRQTYQGQWTPVYDGDRESHVIIVGQLDAPDLINSVAQFVYEVNRIKESNIK
jgi:hypothetical protein